MQAKALRAVLAVAAWLVFHLQPLFASAANPKAGESVLGTLARKFFAPIRYRDLVIPRGERAGLTFNTCGSAPSYVLGTSEPYVQAALARLLVPGMVFFDIGANVGFFSVLGARRVGERGRVYAFEPMSANVAALKHNLLLSHASNAVILAVAVADYTGSADLFLGAEPFWNSLSVRASKRIRNDTIPVPVTSIDELVMSGNLPPPDVVKIDVEGLELAVLRGMTQTLILTKPVIVCEVHNTFKQICDFLTDHGYVHFPLGARSCSKGRFSHLLAHAK